MSRTEFWNYGETVEKIARQYLGFRYRMLPYLYSEAARITYKGSTLMRPFVFDFPHDKKAMEEKYEYMFGPSLLVAPVLQPGATSASVYLRSVRRAGWISGPESPAPAARRLKYLSAWIRCRCLSERGASCPWAGRRSTSRQARRRMGNPHLSRRRCGIHRLRRRGRQLQLRERGLRHLQTEMERQGGPADRGGKKRCVQRHGHTPQNENRESRPGQGRRL